MGSRSVAVYHTYQVLGSWSLAVCQFFSLRVRGSRSLGKLEPPSKRVRLDQVFPQKPRQNSTFRKLRICKNKITTIMPTVKVQPTNDVADKPQPERASRTSRDVLPDSCHRPVRAGCAATPPTERDGSAGWTGALGEPCPSTQLALPSDFSRPAQGRLPVRSGPG